MRYPPRVARVLAEEFGAECRVWVVAEIGIGLRRGGEADYAWTIVAEQLARKAAHFGLQALRERKGHQAAGAAGGREHLKSGSPQMTKASMTRESSQAGTHHG